MKGFPFTPVPPQLHPLRGFFFYIITAATSRKFNERNLWDRLIEIKIMRGLYTTQRERKVWFKPNESIRNSSRGNAILLLFLLFSAKLLCLFVWGEFELLPEDKDEPERLELLDAAIPITFTTRLVLFGQGGLTAARPWRCLHFPHAPVCFTFDAWLVIISCLVWSRPHQHHPCPSVWICWSFPSPRCAPRRGVHAAAYTVGAVDSKINEKDEKDYRNVLRGSVSSKRFLPTMDRTCRYKVSCHAEPSHGVHVPL